VSSTPAEWTVRAVIISALWLLAFWTSVPALFVAGRQDALPAVAVGSSDPSWLEHLERGPWRGPLIMRTAR
jgi:hypothetical protein